MKGCDTFIFYFYQRSVIDSINSKLLMPNSLPIAISSLTAFKSLLLITPETATNHSEIHGYH